MTAHLTCTYALRVMVNISSAVTGNICPVHGDALRTVSANDAASLLPPARASTATTCPGGTGHVPVVVRLPMDALHGERNGVLPTVTNGESDGVAWADLGGRS